MGLPVKRPHKNLEVINPKDVQVIKPAPNVADGIGKMISNWWNKTKIKSDSAFLEAKTHNGELRLRMGDLVLSKKGKEWLLSTFVETRARELERARQAHRTFIAIEEERRCAAESNMNNLKRQDEVAQMQTKRKIAEEEMLIARAQARKREYEDE